MTNPYTWSDHALQTGVAVEDPDIADSNLQYLKYAIDYIKLGNRQTSITYTSSQTLTIAQAGSFITYYGSSNATFTLPTPVGNAGATFDIWNNTGSTLTLSTPVANFYGPIWSNTASLNLSSFMTLTLISDGGNWIPFAGSGYRNLASSGYQILSSGLIVQWGNLAITSKSSYYYDTSITYPITFPNACFSLTANQGNSTNMNIIGHVNPSASSCSLRIEDKGTTNIPATSIYWQAIGN